VPTYNAYGWAATQNNYIWPDGGYVGNSQVMRRNDTGTGYDLLFWDRSADITTLPMKTLSVKHRGIARNTNNYGRVIVAMDGIKLNTLLMQVQAISA
jgi:hypothetical protein